MLTARERVRIGGALNHIILAQKPWPDKNPSPYQGDGDTDGDDNGAHEIGPGEERNMPPKEDPGGDRLNLRASLTDAAIASKNPDAARALLAIEARLAEIIGFLAPAKAGVEAPMLLKLNLLAHIL